MKRTDSRPPFESKRRHYHRYQEEDRDGWKRWVGSNRKPGGELPSLRRFRVWGIALLAVLALAGLISLLYYQLL
jgi:hypothetical protein